MYDGPNAVSNAIGYASQYSGSHDAVIGVYDESGNVIETREHKGDFTRIAMSSQEVLLGLNFGVENLKPVAPK